MTFQEAFTRALFGVLRQGQLSIGASSSCYYEIAGVRCAVGQLLDEKQLAKARRRKVNNKSVYVLVSRGILPEEFNHDFYHDLQVAHDGAQGLFDFIERMKKLGLKYGLTLPPDEEINNAYRASLQLRPVELP